MTSTPGTYHSSSLRSNPTQRHQFAAAAGGFFFDWYDLSLFTFLVIPIAAAMNLSGVQSGALFSVQLGFMAVGGVVFGVLADKFGRTRILMWSIVLFSLGTGLRAVAFDYPSLLVFTAISGFGIGGEFGIGQTLITEVMPARRRGWWSGVFYSVNALAILAATMVGGHLAPIIGWRWSFALSVLPVLFVIYIRKRAPESDPWLQTKARRRNFRMSVQLLSDRRFVVPLTLCLIPATLQFWAYYGITAFLPKYLVDHEGFTLSKAAWWIFFATLSAFVGQLFGAWVNDRLGRRPSIAIIAGTGAVSGVVLAFVFQSVINSPLMLVLLFLLYFGGAAPTGFSVLFSEQFATRYRSTGASTVFQVSRGLSFLPPLIVPGLFAAHGYGLVIGLGAACYLIVAIWPLVLLKETRGQAIEDLDSENEAAVGLPGEATAAPRPDAM